MRELRYLVSRAVFLLLIPLLSSLPAVAATFTVNSTTDAVDVNPGDGVCETAPGSGVCTLRASIQEANAFPGTDNVILPAGTYTLAIPGPSEDLSATGDLDIRNDNVAITGAGSAATIVQACAGASCAGIDRVFDVFATTSDPISVAIVGVTIRNGSPPSAPRRAEGSEPALHRWEPLPWCSRTSSSKRTWLPLRRVGASPRRFPPAPYLW